MKTLKFRSITFVISLAALVAASTSALAQPTYKHKAHLNQFASIPLTATALVASPAAATVAPMRPMASAGMPTIA